MRNGRAIIILRGGELTINMAHVVSVSKTDATLFDLPPKFPEIEGPKLGKERINEKLDKMREHFVESGLLDEKNART